MSKTIAMGIVTILCLALVGCGGSDGPNLKPELDKLTDLVEQQTEKLGELETDLETEREEAADREEALQEQIDDAEEEAEQTQEELAAERRRREAAEEAQRQAEERERQARQAAEEERRRQAQALEANQRAERLLMALGGLADPPVLVAAPSEAAVSVAKKNTLTFGTPGKSSSTRSGFRYAKVTDTFGRTRTTVMYTDRELSRRLLEHYANSRDSDDLTRLDIANTNLGTGVAISGGVISEASTVWDITHRLGALPGVDHDNNATTPRQRPADPANPSPQASYPGMLHGKSGTFVCGGPNCQIQLTPTYAGSQGDVGNSFALESVALTNAGGTGLYFKPTGTPSIDLYEGCPVGIDTEYMVFGYWIEDPESATGTYNLSPFAQVIEPGSGLATFPTEGEARYTGAAVGVYVESPPFGSTDIDKRQGEFEAAVSLTATFGGNVGGWISGFNTTPRGGSAAPRTSNWRVTLADAATAATVSNAIASIDGGGGSGNWAAQFVQARSNAASAEPPAIVGVFDVAGTTLHLVGAFGAEQ